MQTGPTYPPADSKLTIIEPAKLWSMLTKTSCRGGWKTCRRFGARRARLSWFDCRKPTSKTGVPELLFYRCQLRGHGFVAWGVEVSWQGAKVLARLSSTHPRRCPTRRARTYAAWMKQQNRLASRRHQGAGNCREKG